MKKICKIIAIIFLISVSFSAAYAGDVGKDSIPENIIQINKDVFLKKIFNYEKNSSTWMYEGSTPCLINFYADWCGPCRRLFPILTEIAREYGDKIVIYRINIDSEKELADTFGIRGVPLTVFIPLNGKPKGVSGLLLKKNIEEIIDSFLLK